MQRKSSRDHQVLACHMLHEASECCCSQALAVATAPEGRQRNGLLQGGKAAAETILEMRAAGDFSAASTSVYQQRWMQLFGHDFAYVSTMPLCAQ